MSEDRREQIVSAARAIVAEEGLEAVSVRVVARRAGIGASTLRHYFPTQSDLLDELLGPAMDRMVSDLRIEDDRVPPRDRLLECLLQFLPPSLIDPRTASLWLASYAAAVGPNATESGTRTLERLAELARARIDAWLGRLEEEGALLVERGVALRVALTTLDGICVQLLTPGTIFLPEHVEPTLAQVVSGLVRE
ncbi:TetR/AcrR family transcriptional regulator [uncultured Serinicoccus sp.]|uniref:TetR/AcrR family transcriptional regulator n=1 Tax=uncultured Serinicoccus sp. TaxID=735514 RepID=UPI002606C4F9|nr:TetR/AcrR family transcriptional regulator [uncultured Serinicoccus sp.]